jgi:hypothetical protein
MDVLIQKVKLVLHIIIFNNDKNINSLFVGAILVQSIF